MFRLLFSLLPFLLLESTTPSGDPPKDDPPKDDPPKSDDVTFDEKQQKKVNDLIASERKKAEEATAARLKAEADEAKRKADAEAQRKKDEESGEFEKVRASLETERDTIASERDTLKTEHDSLTTYFNAQYDAALKELPDVISAFAPEESDSVTEKATWLEKAQEQAKKYQKANPTGNGKNPPAAGSTKVVVSEEVQKLRKRPAFRSL